MNNSYASLVIQEVCEESGEECKSSREASRRITQLKEAIKKPKKISEENESKIFIALPILIEVVYIA